MPFTAVSQDQLTKVFYGHDSPTEESANTAYGVNFQLLSEMLLYATVCKVAQWATHSCSRPQLATDTGVRDGGLNLLVITPTKHRALP